MNNKEKEVEKYISKIGNIIEKVKNISVEVEVSFFDIYELENSIYIYMKITDDTGSMNALMFSNRDNKEIKDFINSLYTRKRLKTVINCQITGNISVIDKDMYSELNSKGFSLKDIQVGDKLLLIESIKNIENDYDILFGKSISYLYECKLEELYYLIKDNTNYLNSVQFDEIKDIKITSDKDICVLLKNGVVQYNGKKLVENIYCLWFNCGNIYAISNDKRITSINYNSDIGNYLNNDDCKYKKIILNSLSITALTKNGEIRMSGFVVDSGIDYKRFTLVNDIGYNLDKDEVVVIQNNKIKPLLISVIDNVYDKSGIIFEGKSDDDENYFEII